MKIASLYPIEVDTARKVPRIETGAVRASTQFFLHETSHFSAQHIVHNKRYHRIFRKVEQNLRGWIERIGKVLPERIRFGNILFGLKQVRIRYKRFSGIWALFTVWTQRTRPFCSGKNLHIQFRRKRTACRRRAIRDPKPDLEIFSVVSAIIDGSSSSNTYEGYTPLARKTKIPRLI